LWYWKSLASGITHTNYWTEYSGLTHMPEVLFWFKLIIQQFDALNVRVHKVHFDARNAIVLMHWSDYSRLIIIVHVDTSSCRISLYDCKAILISQFLFLGTCLKWFSWPPLDLVTDLRVGSRSLRKSLPSESRSGSNLRPKIFSRRSQSYSSEFRRSPPNNKKKQSQNDFNQLINVL
jgi:hypothetical protein